MSKTPTKAPSRRHAAEILYDNPRSRAATPKSATPMPPSPITAPKIKHLAGVAAAGGTLTKHEQRELGASVLAHIEPRKKPAR
jgi:hypothetical protein